MTSSKKDENNSGKKQQEWACSEGCDLNKGICPHLELLLPSVSSGARKMRDRASPACVANSTKDVFDVMHPEFDVKEFRALMRKFGFVDEWDLELLEMKYFYNMGARRIVKDLGYTSTMTVSRRLAQLRKLLKERGFGK